MFHSQAHSFGQQARLAITLAWIAGYTNILALLACGVAVSHVSGTASNLGRDLADGWWRLGAYALFLLAAFFVGALASGAMTELGRHRGWQSIYVLPMAVEAVLLSIFALGVDSHDHRVVATGFSLWWMTGVASAAMGLQNATITRISGGVVRTTHVTGVVTDLGLEMAQLLWWIGDKRAHGRPASLRGAVRHAHAHPTARRLFLLLSIVGSFALGAMLGTLAYEGIPRFAMVPPVLFLAWIIAQDIRVPIAEIEASTVATDDSGNGFTPPEGLAVYHVRGKPGGGPRHRLPNLIAWADQLPPTTRVVVLDLADGMRLDDQAAGDLDELVGRLRSQRRRLVIAGATPDLYERLRERRGGTPIDAQSICADFEFAVSQALGMLEDEGAESVGQASATLRDTRA